MNRVHVTVIESGTLYTPTERFSPGRLVIDGGIIAAAGDPATIPVPSTAQIVDASTLIVTPGFIDPHIHGCGGVDVMDATYGTLNAVSRIVARHGTTSFLPTTISAPLDVLADALERLGHLLSKSYDGAAPVGIHMEGPFISPARRGTHQASHVSTPDTELLDKWIRVSNHSLKLVTVAPELAGIRGLLTIARQTGVTVGLGHSDATFDETLAAADLGACYAVHTFNAMRAFSHRDPGIVGEILTDSRIFAEIIADGVHVDPAVVRLFGRAKGKYKTLLVTDAISATDMPDGYYRLGTNTVTVLNGVCRDMEGRLAGSTLTQEVAFRNFVEWSGCKFEDALLALTLNPATVLQLTGRGVLEPGAVADVAVLDDSFRVMKTFAAGKLVFDRKGGKNADVADST